MENNWLKSIFTRKKISGDVIDHKLNVSSSKQAKKNPRRAVIECSPTSLIPLVAT